MPARFCPECGTMTPTGARFCMQCGFALTGTPRAGGPRWQPSRAGGVVFGSFLLVGLGIWTSILTPAPPPPRPGGMAPVPAAPAQASRSPHRELPDEVKQAVEKLQARADERPDDVDIWTHLGKVYYRTGQLDPSYYPKALEAFAHVLSLAPDNLEALRGAGGVHYDLKESTAAIAFYDRFLVLEPDDPTVRTDLATMYLFDGQTERAFTIYRAVIEEHPDFMQAHYNLAAAHHQQGDAQAALAELEIARGLATDDDLRASIDSMIARLEADTALSGVRAAAPEPSRSPFQDAVETALRGHQILGPRIARVQWPAPGTARVLVRDFPMEHMPEAVRKKFDERLEGYLRSAQAEHPIEGTVAITLADVASGRELTSVSP